MTQPRSSTLPRDSDVEGQPDVALADFGVENEIARGRCLAEPCREPVQYHR